MDILPIVICYNYETNIMQNNKIYKDKKVEVPIKASKKINTKNKDHLKYGDTLHENSKTMFVPKDLNSKKKQKTKFTRTDLDQNRCHCVLLKGLYKSDKPQNKIMFSSSMTSNITVSKENRDVVKNNKQKMLRAFPNNKEKNSKVDNAECECYIANTDKGKLGSSMTGFYRSKSPRGLVKSPDTKMAKNYPKLKENEHKLNSGDKEIKGKRQNVLKNSQNIELDQNKTKSNLWISRNFKEIKNKTMKINKHQKVNVPSNDNVNNKQNLNTFYKEPIKNLNDIMCFCTPKAKIRNDTKNDKTPTPNLNLGDSTGTNDHSDFNGTDNINSSINRANNSSKMKRTIMRKSFVRTPNISCQCLDQNQMKKKTAPIDTPTSTSVSIPTPMINQTRTKRKSSTLFDICRQFFSQFSAKKYNVNNKNDAVTKQPELEIRLDSNRMNVINYKDVRNKMINIQKDAVYRPNQNNQNDSNGKLTKQTVYQKTMAFQKSAKDFDVFSKCKLLCPYFKPCKCDSNIHTSKDVQRDQDTKRTEAGRQLGVHKKIDSTVAKSAQESNNLKVSRKKKKTQNEITTSKKIDTTTYTNQTKTSKGSMTKTMKIDSKSKRAESFEEGKKSCSLIKFCKCDSRDDQMKKKNIVKKSKTSKNRVRRRSNVNFEIINTFFKSLPSKNVNEKIVPQKKKRRRGVIGSKKLKDASKKNVKKGKIPPGAGDNGEGDTKKTLYFDIIKNYSKDVLGRKKSNYKKRSAIKINSQTKKVKTKIDNKQAKQNINDEKVVGYECISPDCNLSVLQKAKRSIEIPSGKPIVVCQKVGIKDEPDSKSCKNPKCRGRYKKSGEEGDHGDFYDDEFNEPIEVKVSSDGMCVVNSEEIKKVLSHTLNEHKKRNKILKDGRKVSLTQLKAMFSDFCLRLLSKSGYWSPPTLDSTQQGYYSKTIDRKKSGKKGRSPRRASEFCHGTCIHTKHDLRDHECDCYFAVQTERIREGFKQLRLKNKRRNRTLRYQRKLQKLNYSGWGKLYREEMKQKAKEKKKLDKSEKKRREIFYKQRKLEIAALEKSKLQGTQEDANFIVFMLSTICKIIFKVAITIISIPIYFIMKPKKSYRFVLIKLEDPVRTGREIKTWWLNFWYLLCLRVQRNIRESEKMLMLSDTFLESTMVRNLRPKPKTDTQKAKRDMEATKRRQRIKLRSHGALYGCRHILLVTLRKTPCLWVYHLCPSIYPQFLRLLAVMREFCNVLLFLLAVLFWTPCIACMELCRGLMCCVFCAG